MLNIEKYKEELENIGVLNPTELAVIDGKPCMCQEAECNMCELRTSWKQRRRIKVVESTLTIEYW